MFDFSREVGSGQCSVVAGSVWFAKCIQVKLHKQLPEGTLHHHHVLHLRARSKQSSKKTFCTMGCGVEPCGFLMPFATLAIMVPMASALPSGHTSTVASPSEDVEGACGGSASAGFEQT